MTLSILKAHDVQGVLNLKRWKRMKEAFSLTPSNDSCQCICLKSPPNLKIAAMEDWKHVVWAAHFNPDDGKHLGEKDTISSIKTQWCIDLQSHGIPVNYIKDWIIACGCQLLDRHQQEVVSLHASGKQRKTSAVIIVTKMSHVQQDLTDIMIKHKVRLVLLCSTRHSGSSMWVKEYICHQGKKIEQNGDDKQRL